LIQKRILILFLMLNNFGIVFGQSGFQFPKESDRSYTMRFQLINNLIVVPVEVNKTKLSFILDTGVQKNILFSLSGKDSLGLNNVKKVSLYGLGNGNEIEALLSHFNEIKVGDLKSRGQSLYVILNDQFELSGKMGITIHGIIGYQLFKDVIAKINYKTKKITFYNPKNYRYKTCRKCEVFSIEFYRDKPYIDIGVQLDTIGNEEIPIKILVDSGGSDALWLFENSKERIRTPLRYFNAILGEGLSGTIYGNKSRIPKVKLGKFEITQPTVSFLDTLTTYRARKFEERNGSIGGNLLKRFKVWIDYPNKKITLKKNASFSGGFEYDMSGIDILYNGEELVKELETKKVVDFASRDVTNNSTVFFSTNYHYKFMPFYKVSNVLKDSPAEKAGILPGDVLLKFNGVAVYKYSIGEIIQKLQQKEGKRIRLMIRRGGIEGRILKFQFRLKKRI
jgi:hypothetical protein